MQFLLKYACESGCLYVKCGNSDEKFLVTLHKKTEKNWKVLTLTSNHIFGKLMDIEQPIAQSAHLLL